MATVFRPATVRVALEPEQRRAEHRRRARIHAMLLLELLLQAVVEQGEQELLAAGADVARGAVERRQGDLLDLARDPAALREVPVLARVPDRDRLPLGIGEGDPVA